MWRQRCERVRKASEGSAARTCCTRLLPRMHARGVPSRRLRTHALTIHGAGEIGSCAVGKQEKTVCTVALPTEVKDGGVSRVLFAKAKRISVSSQSRGHVQQYFALGFRQSAMAFRKRGWASL